MQNPRLKTMNTTAHAPSDLSAHDRRMLSTDYRWTQFKSGALRRKIDVLFTKGHYTQLISSPCHYCRRAPTPTFRIGIDRIDSGKAYSPENCVPCCPVCNFMKSSMSYGDFMSQVRLIAERGHAARHQAQPPYLQPMSQPWHLPPQQAQQVNIHYNYYYGGQQSSCGCCG